MKLSELQKIVVRGKKRVGRGIGSGLGKTAGRGTKGQKARGKIPVGFSGGGLPTYKKFPKKSGFGNRKVSSKSKLINAGKLNIFKKNSTVDLEQLFNLKLISKKDMKSGVKILSDGKLTMPLTVKLPVSKKAQLEIEKVGGKVEYE